ncbi:hypothetical protein ACQ4PT_011628 [Festuca glaucescens]
MSTPGTRPHARESASSAMSLGSAWIRRLAASCTGGPKSPDVTVDGDENGEGVHRQQVVLLRVPSVDHVGGHCVGAAYGRYLTATVAQDYGEVQVEAVTTDCSGEAEAFQFRHVGRSFIQEGAWDEALEYLTRRRRPGDVTKRPCVGTSASSERHCGHIRAPLDIFLARERTQGVPASLLDTACALGIRYWIDTLKEWMFARLGFGSPIPTIPRAWSWMNAMSPPVHQTGGDDDRGDGSCVICSTAMCIHAQHRLAFERLFGAGSFPSELADIDYLKIASHSARVWSPVTGSYPAGMLDFIKLAFPEGLRCPAGGPVPCRSRRTPRS